MALGIYTGVAFAVVGGDISPASAATVDVKREDTNTAAAIFSDRAGTAPLVNPSALADVNGRFQFYAAPIPQGYKITVTSPAGSYVLRNQQVQLDATAFGMTLLDDADATAARGTLVVPASAPAALVDLLRVGLTSVDSSTTLLVRGTSKGVRIGTSPSGGSIDGVDNTGSVTYQPLAIGGSVVAFNTAGNLRWTIDGSGHVLPGSDGTNDIGSLGSRVRNLFMAGPLAFGDGAINRTGTFGNVSKYVSGDFQYYAPTAGTWRVINQANSVQLLALDDGATSATFGGKVIGPAGTTAKASMRAPHGVAPTAPADGDIWTTSAGLFVQVNGVTVGPLGAAGGGIPVGMIGYFHAVPAGWLQCNGQSVNKATYPALWTYGSAFVTTDQTLNPGLYVNVDASFFKVPNLSGIFLRGAGAVDANHTAAALGVKQADANLSHTHTAGGGGGFQTTVAGPAYGSAVTGLNSAATTDASGGTEARPVNVALIPCVKT